MLDTTKNNNNTDTLISLAISIIEGGINEEGIGYLETEGGRSWLNTLYIDVDQFIDYVHRSFKRAS